MTSGGSAARTLAGIGGGVVCAVCAGADFCRTAGDCGCACTAGDGKLLGAGVTRTGVTSAVAVPTADAAAAVLACGALRAVVVVLCWDAGS